LGDAFLASSAVWYASFRLKPSVYVLSFPWIFGLVSFLIGLLPVYDAFALISPPFFMYFERHRGKDLTLRFRYNIHVEGAQLLVVYVIVGCSGGCCILVDGGIQEWNMVR